MRVLVVTVLVVGCGKSSKSEPPPVVGSGSGSGTGSAQSKSPRTVELADVPVAAGAPFTLHALKVMRVAMVQDGKLTEDTGDLELRVTVKPTTQLADDARLSIVTTCRTHDLNLTFDEDRMPGHQVIADAIRQRRGEVSSIFHSDPFTDPPQPCELTLRYRATKDAPPVTAAVACYKDDKLVATACPDGTFPPPPADAELSVTSPVKADFLTGTVGIHGLFTLSTALAPTEKLGSTWRCSDGKTTAISKNDADTVVFWTPSAMGAGTTAHGGLTTFLDGSSMTPARCELTVLARSATPRVLGVFCIDNAGAVTRGACTPKI